MICPKCGEEASGPYVKVIKGHQYVYMAHYKGRSKTKWCYLSKSILLNSSFFENGKFTRTAELSQLITRLWRREELFNWKVKKIYVHGSQVKGTYKKGSDLDVWVEVGGECEAPITLTATKRMVKPPEGMPRLKLGGVEVEVACASFKPKPPYFDVFEQELILSDG